MVVRDQRSGGCEAAADNLSLLQVVGGSVLGFGPDLPGEESDVGALESKPQKIHIQDQCIQFVLLLYLLVFYHFKYPRAFFDGFGGKCRSGGPSLHVFTVTWRDQHLREEELQL